MPVPVPLSPAQHAGPLAAALVFVLSMSLVPEPARRHLNLALVAGAAGVYMSGGGFGVWEVAYPVLSTVLVYRAMRADLMQAYRLIGLAWCLHAAWDLLHHRFGHEIWPFLPASSWGCMLFDSAIALWFFAGARSPWRRRPVGIG